MSDWKHAVERAAQRPAAADETTGLGLLLELRQLSRAGSQWVAPSAETASAPLSEDADYRLAVRPVHESATGWARGDLTWSTMGFQTHRLALRPEQVRWFAQFAALHRAGRDGFMASEKDWLYLEDFASPLLWPLLAEADGLGIPLVTGRREGVVQLAEQVDVRIVVRTDESSRRGGDLHLDPVVDFDGQRSSAVGRGLVGDHGVYWAQVEPARIVLGATSAAGALAGATTVPASEREEFLRDWFPRLARRVTLEGRGIDLPEVEPPRPRLTVRFLPDDALRMRWDWDDDEARPVPAEFATLPTELEGVDAAEFAVTTLRALERRADVTVTVVGARPPYRRLTGRPVFDITRVESHRRDWFDLGILITVGEHSIPFTDVVKALSRGRNKVLLVDKSYLTLDSPAFDALRELLDEAAALAEWDPAHPTVPRHQAVFWDGFDDDAADRAPAREWRDRIAALDGSVDELPDPEGLALTLRPYQRQGFARLAYLHDHGLGGVLADDMGLGKTVQTIALMLHERARSAGESTRSSASAGPVEGATALDATTTTRLPWLVVAPSSVLPVWEDELARCAPGLSVASVTARRQRTPADADVVVTTYAMLRLEATRFARGRWAGVVLDEAQAVKNPASLTHEAAAALDAPFVLALSGTPVENGLLDLWAILRLTSPGLFPSRVHFTEHYLKPIAAGDRSRLELLQRRIRPFLLRRTKEEVAPELPPRQEQVVHVELSPAHRDLYDLRLHKERQKVLGLVDDLDRQRFIVFRSLTLLRLLALDPRLVDHDADAAADESSGAAGTPAPDIPSAKLDALLELLEPVIAEGHRALVVSQFTSYLALARERLDAAGIAHEYLDGGTLKRGEVVKRFRQGDAPVFVVSLKAGGVGLTLTEADYVFLLDPWWNPAAEQQAIDRTHRIGQTRPVTVYRLVAADTIEHKVMALRDEKSRLIGRVLADGGSSAALDPGAAAAATAAGAGLTADDIRALLG